MRMKFLSLAILIAFCGVLFGQACSDTAMLSGNGNESSEANFSLSAANLSIAAGAQVLITTNGGTPPFSFTVNSGGGSISAGGMYTAPTSVTTLDTSIIIQCQDALGNAADITLYVVPNALTVTVTPNPVAVGSAAAIYVNGGQGSLPSVQKLTGSGTYTSGSSGGTYSSAYSEVATFQAMDSLGHTYNFSITVGAGGGSSGAALQTLAITPPGTHHVLGANGLGCPQPSTTAGSVADAYSPGPYGDQMFCSTLVSSATGTQVIDDIAVSPANAGQHASNPSCPSGYTEIGAVVDCFGGAAYCSGYQRICAHYISMRSGVTPVLEFRVTQQGLHSPSPGASCPSGLTAIGHTTDCANNYCSGYQTLCARK